MVRWGRVLVVVGNSLGSLEKIYTPESLVVTQPYHMHVVEQEISQIWWAKFYLAEQYYGGRDVAYEN